MIAKIQYYEEFISCAAEVIAFKTGDISNK